MAVWYRVFGRSDSPVPPAAVRACLTEQGDEVDGQFNGEADWTAAELRLGADTLELERFSSTEEGIRAELNNWAAFLETCDHSSNNVPLMEHMIQTRQLFTLRQPPLPDDPARLDELCLGLCRYLAERTDGVYQVDEEGFYTPDGVLILPEA
jgi:hypothetical protein